MEKVTVFVDTNAFIQLRDLKDIPWQELFPGAKRVAIMVARPVIQELDKHKVSTNSRRRNRARSALKLIDQASAASDRTMLLREAPIHISLTVPRRIEPDWVKLPDLDQNDPDDQLVAAAHAYAEGAILLSHDSGPRISARDVGLPAHEPPQGWLLPLQQSDDQRKIRGLERDLEQALSRYPLVSVAFPQSEDGDPIVLYRYKLPQLPQNIVDGLAYDYINAHPKEHITATVYPFGRPTGVGPGFTSDDQARYGREYAKFINKVHDYFANLHERLGAVAGIPELLFTISNTGGGSASKLVVSIKVDGDFGLVADQDRSDVAGSLELPEAPIPRMASQDQFRASIAGLQLSPVQANRPIDPTETRWIDRPKIGEVFGSYGCDDFRPGRNYEDSICLWPGSLPSHGSIQVSASAEHMAEVSAEREVVIEERVVSWSNITILEMLPKSIREAIAAKAE